MLRNTEKRFGSLAKWFHWVVAILAIGLLILGYLIRTGSQNTAGQLIGYHKFFAVILFFTMLIRLIWRWINPRPRVSKVPCAQAALSWVVHYSMYISVFTMAIAGWLMSSWGGHSVFFLGLNLALPVEANQSLSHVFGNIHYWTAWTLFVLIGLHFLAALYHQFILRDKLINNMLPQKKNNLFN
jgi:cytochrome b561